jgi:hypothetical protein
MTAPLCVGQMNPVAIFSRGHQLFKVAATRHVSSNSDVAAAVYCTASLPAVAMFLRLLRSQVKLAFCIFYL